MREGNEIGNAFAEALKRMIQEPDATVSRAARALGVSRQAFHAYLGGTLPRRKTLHRAVHLWNLKLDLGAYSFGKGAFGREETKPQPAAKPTQRMLWEVLDAVKEEDLHITMKRVGKVLRFDVRVDILA